MNEGHPNPQKGTIMNRASSIILTGAVLIILPIILHADSNIKVWGRRGPA